MDTQVKPVQLSSKYLWKIFDNHKYHNLIARSVKTIQQLKDELKFDTIVFMGHSGASVAYPIHYLTGIPIALVRKSNDNCHGYSVEGEHKIYKYLIVDDFIATGDTIRMITEKIDYNLGTLECAGVYCYNSDDFSYIMESFKSSKFPFPVFNCLGVQYV